MPQAPIKLPAINTAAAAIENAEALIVLAGAGMGVDSGLPDYRGDDGLWRAYPRLKHLGLSFAEMANPKWFDEHPALAWAFYGHRQQLYRETPPHRGFGLLKAWAEAMPRGYFVYTSNVDGHFQSAGLDDARLIECHGNIHRLQCTGPCQSQLWQESNLNLDIDLDTLEARGELPRCPECGELARPNVLMFYDWHWVRDVTLQQFERYTAWIRDLQNNDARIAIVEIGAGAALAAVRHEAETLLAHSNAALIRINPREAEGPDGTIPIPLPALEALEEIEAVLSEGLRQDRRHPGT